MDRDHSSAVPILLTSAFAPCARAQADVIREEKLQQQGEREGNERARLQRAREIRRLQEEARERGKLRRQAPRMHTVHAPMHTPVHAPCMPRACTALYTHTVAASIACGCRRSSTSGSLRRCKARVHWTAYARRRRRGSSRTTRVLRRSPTATASSTRYARDPCTRARLPICIGLQPRVHQAATTCASGRRPVWSQEHAQTLSVSDYKWLHANLNHESEREVIAPTTCPSPDPGPSSRPGSSPDPSTASTDPNPDPDPTTNP